MIEEDIEAVITRLLSGVTRQSHFDLWDLCTMSLEESDVKIVRSRRETAHFRRLGAPNRVDTTPEPDTTNSK